MASLSSSSVSTSSSLGNTSLRGFGGLASGIDRDAIIEQMSMATNTKISSQKSAMTKLEWKQEAYRNITDKVLDLTDKYASYSSSSNLKDPSIFSKSLVTTHGVEASTRFVKAVGTSALVDNVSIAGVSQLATSTVLQSNSHISQGGLATTLDKGFSQDVHSGSVYTSNLSGRQLTIGIIGHGDGGKSTLTRTVTYTFEGSYTDADGKKQTIDYIPKNEDGTIDYQQLTDNLNAALMASDKEITVDESTTVKLNELFEFTYDESSGQIGIAQKSNPGFDFGIDANSSALRAVGGKVDEPIRLSAGTKFDAGMTTPKQTTLDYLTNKSLIFEYDGVQKNVSLLTGADAQYLKDDRNFDEAVETAVKKAKEKAAESGTALTDKEEKAVREDALASAKLMEMKSRLQARLDTAFGAGAIKVNTEDDGPLTFNTGNPTSSVAILSNDNTLLKNLGLEFGSSNKVNVDGKLGQASLGLKASDYTDANGQLDLKINGVSITGLTANSTISDILSKINSTKAAGVKATYVEATGQFMLVSSETGAGRQISLDSELSKALFGGAGTDGNGNLVGEDRSVLATKDADGNFWLDSDPSQRVDANGNYIDAEGRLLHKNEDGSFVLVNGSGYLVDEKGRLITGEKDGDGNDELIDKNGYLINEAGQFIDKNGKTINKDGHLIDEQNRLIDAGGNFVDKDGYLVNEAGKFVDTRDNLIDSEGYRIDENGNYLMADDKYARQVGETWYEMDEHGNYQDKGSGIPIRYIDGRWQEVDDDGKPVEGSTEEIHGPKESNSSDRVKGDGVGSEDAPVKTEAATQGAGLVKTDGPIYKGITRLDGLKSMTVEGQNAKIAVSYGNGIVVNLERSSNTFNLEGMTITVSGTFGYLKDERGNLTDELDTSQAVTFSAKADVDAAVERVKSFMEDFNAMITEINSQVTARPDSSYGPLTDEQKDEMDETSIENWEKKAKQGILFNDDVIRDLSASTQGILSKLMSYGVNYQDLEKIGITYSEDYTDGGILVFDESKFRNAMESNPDLVSNIFTGGGDVKKGLISVVEETLNPYATRYASKNGGSYGRLIEVAGTEKKPTTLLNNQIYKQLKEMEETIAKLRERLKVEQDRYIAQFTTMETLINKMNTQSSYLSQIMA